MNSARRLAAHPEPKLVANRERDARKAETHGAAGWPVRMVWECETRPAGRADDLAAVDQACSPVAV